MDSYQKIFKFASSFQKFAFQAVDDAAAFDLPIFLAIHEGDTSLLIALSEDKEAELVIGACSLTAPDVTINPQYKNIKWKALHALYSKDPIVAIQLMGAAAYLGKNLVTSYSVSPAIDENVQKIYEKEVNTKNTAIIIDNVVRNISLKAKPWLLAGYINNGNNDSEYAEAFKEGDLVKQSASPEEIEEILNIVSSDWQKIYASESLTKRDKGKTTIVNPEPNTPDPASTEQNLLKTQIPDNTPVATIKGKSLFGKQPLQNG